MSHTSPAARRLELAFLVMCTAVLLILPAAASADVTYSYTQTIPVPPASSYAGSGGGDGWAVAMTPTAVYNVFHHSSRLQVACHLQSDASACWSPKTIRDAGAHDFAISGQPGLWLDQANGHLFVYATRPFDATAGVVCIDTTQPAGNLNPFCGFTVLAAAGDAPSNSGVSNAALVGSRWYAFNYVDGAGSTGGQNKLLCFDTVTAAACAGQPFTVAFGGGAVSAPNPTFRVPPVTAVGTQVIVPIVAGGEQLGCFDGATNGACGGAWPASAPAGYSATYGAAFPTLSVGGTTTGLCLPSPGIPCYSLAGAPTATPAGLTAVVSPGNPWNGTAFTLGPRIYVPNGLSDTVQCFDFSTSAGCPNFPRSLPGLSYLYSVNPDPHRASCIWVNADGGAGQIQNFDAYTGAGCGQGPIRVLASSIVVPTQTCTPTSYTSLQVVAPPRGSYASGTVAFLDGSGAPIPGIADRAVDGTGTVSLTGLNLNTATGLPQFLITLTGAQGDPAEVVVKLVWTGVNDPSCVRPGTIVEPGTDHYRLEMKAWIPHDGVVDPEQPITLPYLLASVIHRPCHTPSLLLRAVTSVSTRYEGDKHNGYDGSFRVQSSLEFDWDGAQITNPVSRAQFGTTRLTATYRNFRNTNTCQLASGAARAAANASGEGSSFALHYSAANPLVRRLPSPAISGDTTGTIAADGTVRFHYRTDLFPSHGVRVSKNGTPQRTDIVNDASCLPNSFVTGMRGVIVLGAGLLSQVNQGDRTVLPADTNVNAKTNTALCLGL